MFKIPARITTVDYVGVHNEVGASYRDRAMSELETLYSHMEFNGLTQLKRTINTGSNIRIDCHISFGAATAVIIVGADSEISINQHACFCTAYGVLAGRIMQLHDEVNEPESVIEHYEEDQSYAADIRVCQKAGLGKPKLIETREIRSSGGSTKETIKLKTSAEFWISEEFINVPFTDRYPHKPGELVLILAMPLVDYRPDPQFAFPYGMTHVEKHGAWSPEVNKRRIVNNYWAESDPPLSPEAMITARYIASTGMTNLLTMDAYMWDGEPDNADDARSTEDLEKELRYNPFRILPIPLDSCFSGYKL